MDAILYNPIVNLYLFLYKSLFENFTLSIIVFTLIVQLILWPLTIQQYRAQKKLKELGNKAKSLQEKRATGKSLSVAEMQEQMQYMKSACATCLPILIQMPVIFFLFDIINKVAHGEGTVFNHIAYSDSLRFPEGYKFHLDLFGADLSKTIFNVGFNNIFHFIVLLVIVIATTIAQYYSIKLTSSLNKPDPKVQEIDATAGKKKKKKTKPEEIKPPSLADELTKNSEQMTKILTVVILAFSISFPVALSIYWLARSIFVIILTKLQVKYIIKDKK